MKFNRLVIAAFMAVSTLFGAVNINTASKDELMSLEGIGESKANAIIEYRKSNKFKSIDEIKNVKGIGDKIFEDIKSQISISADTKINSKDKDAKNKDSDNKKNTDNKKDKDIDKKRDLDKKDTKDTNKKQDR